MLGRGYAFAFFYLTRLIAHVYTEVSEIYARHLYDFLSFKQLLQQGYRNQIG